MPKKSHLKKKAFQKNCRGNVKKGLVNTAAGGWAQARSDKTTDTSMVAGYNFK